MPATRSDETAETSFTRDLLHGVRYYLGGRRGLLILAGLAAIAGLALNWSWLVAAGIAPILVGVLPCLAMCALGLCMNRASGNSCTASTSVRETPVTRDDTAPAPRAVRPDVPPDSPVGQLPGGAVAAPVAEPDPQPLKERSTTDA